MHKNKCVCFNDGWKWKIEHKDTTQIDLGLQFFNWDSIDARLNSHHEAWGYKKKKHKKIKAYKKFV